MKRLYIYTAIIGSILFSSCEKEIMSIEKGQPDDNHPDYIINPEDTAGIIVPDGYSLVIFPGSKVQTRAAINGESNRISHLKYLIYQDDGTGAYKLLKEKTVFSTPGTKTWPYTAQTELLPSGKTYKVVFLGNVDSSLFDEEVLTGTATNANYAEARIHLPSKGFSDTNMFHWFRSDPFTPASDAANNNIIPVTLQRIVSRYRIIKEQLDENYSSGNYRKDYYSQLLDKQLKDDFFTGRQSLFAKSLKAAIAEDLIKSILYVVEKRKGSAIDATTYPVKTWYDSNPIDNDTKNNIDFHESTSGDKIKIDPDAGSILAQQLYNICVQTTDELLKDEKLIENWLSNIYTENKLMDNSEAAITVPSYYINRSKAKDLILNSSYLPNGVLYWTGLSTASIDMTGSDIPSEVDFELNPTNNASWQTKDYNFIASDGINDKHLSIFTLGTTDNSKKIKVNKIQFTLSDGTIATLSDISFECTALAANTSIDKKLIFSDIALNDYTAAGPASENYVVVCYYDLLNSFIQEEGGNLILKRSDNTTTTMCSTSTMTKASLNGYLEIILNVNKKYKNLYNFGVVDFSKEVFPIQFQYPSMENSNIKVVSSRWE